MLQLRSLSIGYSEWDDRIQLACSDGMQVQRLWLTRRVVGRLLASGTELLEKSSLAATRAPADLRSEVIAFEHQSAMTQPDAIRSGGPPAPPSGLADLGVALVHKLQIDVFPAHFRLLVHGPAGPLVTGALRRPDLHRVLAVIDQYATTAGWALSHDRTWLGSAALGESGPSPKLAS